MLIEKDYYSKCKKIGVTGNWNKYKYCYDNYENYFDLALKKIKNKEKIIVVFMEAGPQETSNYIFSDLSKVITIPSKENKADPDQYLTRIYKGFLENEVVLGKTKREALVELLEREIPVVLMDLFPFHGVKLESDNREKICDNLNIMLDDSKDYISRIKNYKKYILFGVPYTIWHLTGGQGIGSLYADLNAHLGNYINKKVVINMGGQSLSSTLIKKWVKSEELG